MIRRGPIAAIAALAVIGLVLFLSPNASERPDGLERVASDLGVDEGEKEHVLGDGPLADYSLRGVEDPDSSRRIAGLIGVLVTFVLVVGMLSLARRYARRRDAS